MKKALVTGITGQDGSYLAELLLEKGYAVHGVVRRSSTCNLSRIAHIRDSLTLHQGDLGDHSSLKRVVEHVQPDEVYNLAAMSHVKISFDMPEYTADVDGVGVVRLLEAVKSCCPEAKFYQASTSELFGKVKRVPQDEETPFHPRSPYGVAKLMGYWAVVNYREAYQLYAANGILFNHESPRRGENFVTRKITMAVAKIRKGLQDKLLIGNLDAKRDWGYAKDFVEGMWMILQHETPEDFVLATGETQSVRRFVEHAFAAVDICVEWDGEGVRERGRDAASGKVLVEVAPEFFRPAEVDLLIGDPSKAKEKLGWIPKTRFEDLVGVMIEEDLKLLEESLLGARS